MLRGGMSEAGSGIKEETYFEELLPLAELVLEVVVEGELLSVLAATGADDSLEVELEEESLDSEEEDDDSLLDDPGSALSAEEDFLA